MQESPPLESDLQRAAPHVASLVTDMDVSQGSAKDGGAAVGGGHSEVGRPELEEAAAIEGQGPETGPASSVEQGKEEGGGCRQERNSSPRRAEQPARPGLGEGQEEGPPGAEQAEEAAATEAVAGGGAGSEPRAAASPGREGAQQETGAGSGSVGVSRSSGAKRARSGTLELDLNAPAGDKAPAEPSATGSPLSGERHPQGWEAALLARCERLEAALAAGGLGLQQERARAQRTTERHRQDKLDLEQQLRTVGERLQAAETSLQARAAGEAGVGAVVAEVERCLAGQAELAARLAGSKAMLEQRDELIRQLNVGVRAATLAKEAALQRAADLEARAAANQRTVATLSAEIAECRETERLVAAALDLEGDPALRPAHMEALQQRLATVLHRRRRGCAEAPPIPAAFLGPFAADPTPAFPRAVGSPGPAPLSGGFDMNGPPPSLLAASLKHQPALPVPPLLPAPRRDLPPGPGVARSSEAVPVGASSLLRQATPSSGELRGWEGDAARSGRGSSLGPDLGWWGPLAAARGAPASEGLRQEAAMREWYSNSERASAGGELPADAGGPPPERMRPALSLAELVGSMDWLAGHQQARPPPLAWPHPATAPSLFPAQPGGELPAGGAAATLLNGLAGGGAAPQSSTRLRLSPSQNSAFSAPARGGPLAPLHPPITLAEILARPSGSSQQGGQSSPSSTLLEKQASGTSQEAAKRRQRRGKGAKPKDGAAPPEGEGDPAEAPEGEEGSTKRGTKPRGKRGCPVCGNLLAAAAADCPKCGHIFRPSKWNTRTTHGLPDDSPRAASLQWRAPSGDSGPQPQLTLRTGPAGGHPEEGPHEEAGDRRWRHLEARPALAGSQGRAGEGGPELGQSAWWQSSARDEGSLHGGRSMAPFQGGLRQEGWQAGGKAAVDAADAARQELKRMEGQLGAQGMGGQDRLGPHLGNSASMHSRGLEWGRQQGGTGTATMSTEPSRGGAAKVKTGASNARGRKRKAAAARPNEKQSASTGPVTQVFNWAGDGKGAHSGLPGERANGVQGLPLGIELSLASADPGQQGDRHQHMQHVALAAAGAPGLNLNLAHMANSYAAKDKIVLGWGRDLDLTKN